MIINEIIKCNKGITTIEYAVLAVICGVGLISIFYEMGINVLNIFNLVLV